MLSLPMSIIISKKTVNLSPKSETNIVKALSLINYGNSNSISTRT